MSTLAATATPLAATHGSGPEGLAWLALAVIVLGLRRDDPPPWTVEHVRIVLEVRDAWNHLVQTRRAYDQSRPQLSRGHHIR